MVFIDKYRRRDGTEVRAHSRWAPGARREMTIFAVISLVVVGFGTSGTGGGTGSGGKAPRPKSTAVYPVKFPGWENKPRPTPTVSYPIRWDRTP